MSSPATTRQGRPEHGPWDRPLLFWREEDGRRTGLACLPTFCDNPGCTCQEVFLQAFEVDDRFQKISVHGEHVHVLAEKKGGPPPEGQLFVVVDLETGRLIRVDHASPRRRKAELLRRLEESIDAKTLADLRARWQSYKEELKAESSTVDAWRSRDWTKWDGAEPVGWYEVHPETPEDRYQLDRDIYDAADFYCIIPGCDCGQVTVRFGKVEDDEIAQVIGEVFLEPSGCEVVGTGNAPGERRVLETLWALYEESHDLSELSRRYRVMQRLGPEIHALRDRQLRPPPVRRGAKVGRNEPCPCGSGRKFKKCCGRHG